MLFRIMSYIIFVKIKFIGDYFFYFHFSIKNYFYVKIKIRGITSNDLNLGKFYPDHNPEQ